METNFRKKIEIKCWKKVLIKKMLEKKSQEKYS